ncbi:MAG: hypothetical protein HUK03_09720, partial [Bacteroidaceae bacterium]|nr:hypothetical protein [Bacteroidaceae bacterium]
WGETSANGGSSTAYDKDNAWLYSNKYTDASSNLTLEHDAAYTNWGDPWRMPTEDEARELIENCTTDWTTVNGVRGRKLTSRQNGNSIFLPAAGYHYGTSTSSVGNNGLYWDSTPRKNDVSRACSLGFNANGIGRAMDDRRICCPVRPVSKKYKINVVEKHKQSNNP